MKPNEVPNDFFCAICLSIPIDPRIIGPCSHIFCEGCIHDSLAYKKVCPVCLHGCRSNQVHVLKNKNSLANRIWSNIVVKCKHVDHCGWTGSIEDYRSHLQSCTVAVENENLRSQAKQFTESVQRLKTKLNAKDLEIANLLSEIQTLQTKLEKKERKIDRLSRQLSRQVVRKGVFFGFLRTRRSDASASSNASASSTCS